MNNLATVLRDQGKYEQAEEMHRQVLGLRETVLGKEHPDTLTSMYNLAMVLRDQGQYEQAEEMLRTTSHVQHNALHTNLPQAIIGA
jgi:tetratricopeptide (TPR) repeat protein